MGPRSRLAKADLLPPFLLRLYHRYVRKIGFFGTYTSWADAQKASTGYDADNILTAVKEASLKVTRGQAVYERDSVLFDEVHYSWPLLAALLWVATQSRNGLSVIDFGGSLGSTYRQNIAFLSHLPELTWSVVEQENFVHCGRTTFADEHLRFYCTIDECLAEQVPQVILFSSVLQYVERPYSLLQDVKRRRFPFVLFDRTTFIDEGDDRLTVQHVPSAIYQARYPAWFFNRQKFDEFFADTYDLVAEFDALAGSIDLGDRSAHDKGLIFRLRPSGEPHKGSSR